MTTLALTELLGATVYDPSGAASGRVREVTLAPQEDRSRVASLIVKTKSGNRVLAFPAVSSINAGVWAKTGTAEWPGENGAEGLFMLERDLLDQQVIDINGRKVVRVNDVELLVDAQKDASGTYTILRVQSVDVGARGAVRRLLRGVAPKGALHAHRVILGNYRLATFSEATGAEPPAASRCAVPPPPCTRVTSPRVASTSMSSGLTPAWA